MNEKSPLKYALVKNASCLTPISIIWQPEQSRIRFRHLTDQLYSLKKIASSVADMSKNHYEDLLKMANYKHKEKFLKFSDREDRLDVFLGNYICC